MPGITVRSCDDLPYGPGQSDYEYDGWRDRRDSQDNAQQQADEERRRAEEEQSHPQ